MKAMLEIADRLEREYLNAHEIREKLAWSTQRLEEMERGATPETGWPGSNETQRKAARLKALEATLGYVPLTGEIQKLQTALSLNAANLEGLRARRRALEWSYAIQFLKHPIDPLQLVTGDEEG